MASEIEIKCEIGATSPATVVAGLGYPNGRQLNSPEPTGWKAPRK